MSAAFETVLRFRDAAPADLDRIAQIESRAYAFPWSLGNFRDSLAYGHRCMLCITRDALVAYSVLMTAVDESHLLNLTVDVDYQGRGIGTRMLARILDLAQSDGARRLLLEVRPSNGPALRLYQRAGFKIIGLRKNYYPSATGREDALVMSLDL